MNNAHIYKKMKYDLALGFLYNVNMYHKLEKQTLLNMCQYFQIEFNNRLYSTISDFAHQLGLRIRMQTNFLFYSDEMLLNYANAHNIKLYDIKEHKIIN